MKKTTKKTTKKTVTKSQLARRSKQKGKQFEKSVAQAIAATFGLELSDVYNARSGKKEADIQLSAAAKDVFPFHVECKNHKTLAIPAWLRQAESDCPGDMYPALVFKQHGSSKKYAVIDFDLFLHLAATRNEAVQEMRAAAVEDE